jgi:hypothetical protein
MPTKKLRKWRTSHIPLHLSVSSLLLFLPITRLTPTGTKEKLQTYISIYTLCHVEMLLIQEQS